MKTYQVCLNDSCKNNLILQSNGNQIQECIDSQHKFVKSEDLIKNAQSSIKIFQEALDLLKECYIFNQQPGLSNKFIQMITDRIQQELEQSIKYSHQSIICLQNGFIDKQFLTQLLYIDLDDQVTNIQQERMKMLVTLLQQINARKMSRQNIFKCEDLIEQVDQKHIQIISIDILAPDFSFLNKMTVYAFLPSIQTLYLSIIHQQLTEQENDALCHFLAIQTSLNRFRLKLMVSLNNYDQFKNIIQSLVINRSIKYLTLDQSPGFLPSKLFYHLAHLIKQNQNIQELKLLFEFTKFQFQDIWKYSLVDIIQELVHTKSINYFYGYFNSVIQNYNLSHHIAQMLAKNKIIQEFCLETTSIKHNLTLISQGLKLNEGLQYFNLTGKEDYEIDEMVVLCMAAEDRMQNSTLRRFNSYNYVIPYEYKQKFKVLTEYQNLRYQALFYISAYQKHFAPYIIYNPYIQYIDLFVD